MKLGIFHACVLIGAVIALPLPVMAESIFLKDGSIAEGTIQSENDSKLVLKLSDSTKKEISRADITRIAYGEEYKTKSFIYKNDDTMIEAYVVDENREMYFIRTNLTSNEEIQLPKKMVIAVSVRRIGEKAPEADAPVVKSKSTFYFLGFAAPGLGQLYAEYNFKGVVFLTAFAGAAGYSYYSLLMGLPKITTNSSGQQTTTPADYSKVKIGLAVTAGVYVLNWLDIILFTSLDTTQKTALAPAEGFNMSAFCLDDSSFSKKSIGAGLAFNYNF